MNRIIAVDYGRKRTGIAVSDPLRIVVSALGTFAPIEAITFLKKYIQNEPVDAIVVGRPIKLDGSPSQSAQGAEQFAKRLAKTFPHIKLERYDERFTSKIAIQAMITGDATLHQRKNKALIDQISACVILQSYLDYCQNMLNRI